MKPMLLVAAFGSTGVTRSAAGPSRASKRAASAGPPKPASSQSLRPGRSRSSACSSSNWGARPCKAFKSATYSVSVAQCSHSRRAAICGSALPHSADSIGR